MAKEKTKKSEAKLVLEREYIVPLRREWLKVAKFKRANRAVKALKKFLARHMKVYDRDLRKIKLDIILNNELRFRGMRKPLSKVHVKAKKFDDGNVKVELVKIPEHIRFARLREEKKKTKIEEKKPEPVKPEEITPAEESKKAEETKEKEEASKEDSLKISKEKAREQKHISKDKKVLIHRKAMSR
ncbi:60S ribosomal protein L31 [Candidatus Pacearchaeota archaeon]|nr:60S ribosomal protein L31 [Candidatus Pacearchaeota archaeon]